MEGHTSSHGNVIPSPVSLLTSYYHTTSCDTVWDNYNLLCLESGLYSIGTMCNSQCYTGARQIEGSNNRIRCFRESWKPHEEPRWDPTPLHCQGGLPVSYFIPSQKNMFYTCYNNTWHDTCYSLDVDFFSTSYVWIGSHNGMTAGTNLFVFRVLILFACWCHLWTCSTDWTNAPLATLRVVFLLFVSHTVWHFRDIPSRAWQMGAWDLYG